MSALLQISQFLLISFLIQACAGNLPEYVYLEKLRVLAIPVDPPIVRLGQESKINFLISDVKGGGRTIQYKIDICPDPGLAQDANAECRAEELWQSFEGSFTLEKPFKVVL